jgi:hypothetical protein
MKEGNWLIKSNPKSTGVSLIYKGTERKACNSTRRMLVLGAHSIVSVIANALDVNPDTPSSGLGCE